MDYMMSNNDFKNMLGDDIKIIEFPKLEQYNNINDLLVDKKDYCIIFYIENIINGSQVGHWTALMRDNKKYFFFDSYGITEKNELSFISKQKRLKYNEDINYLDKLLKNTNYTNNKYQYQKFKNNINTCGRYVLIILFLFINMKKFNFDDVYNILSILKKKYKLKSYDELSVFLTE
jgi:hypothetical protein